MWIGVPHRAPEPRADLPRTETETAWRAMRKGGRAVRRVRKHFGAGVDRAMPRGSDQGLHYRAEGFNVRAQQVSMRLDLHGIATDGEGRAQQLGERRRGVV